MWIMRINISKAHIKLIDDYIFISVCKLWIIVSLSHAFFQNFKSHICVHRHTHTHTYTHTHVCACAQICLNSYVYEYSKLLNIFLIFLFHRFSIYKFSYLLKFIFNLQINICSTFMVLQGHMQSRKRIESPDMPGLRWGWKGRHSAFLFICAFWCWFSYLKWHPI